jgi:hypothetical protein
MADNNSNIAEIKDKKFLYMEAASTPLNPLVRVENPRVLANMIDPTTGHPYEGGIVLEGEFASMDVLNNNNRIYTEDNYLQFVELLKKQVFSPKGVYGELEHPKGYATDTKNVSHKILDIWYDKALRKVFGIVLVLNTPNGKIAQEIIKSGGRLGISARGGGKETKNADGSITAALKLLVTFDLVYHPGFTTSDLGFTELNESQKFDLHKKRAITIYEDNIDKLDDMYGTYLNECVDGRMFFEWLNDNPLFESSGPKLTPEEKADEKKLESGQTNGEAEAQNNLSSAVDKQLNEQQQIFESKQQAFYEQMRQSQLGLGRKMKANAALGKSYYDNSAGFVTTNQDEPDDID